MEKHPGAVESDLQRYYHVDVRDVFRPGGGTSELTPRRVLTLLGDLDETSALHAHERGGRRYRGWTYDRYLRKAQVETERNLLYVTQRANGDKKAKAPQPLPGPDDQAKKVKEGQNAFAAMAAQRLAAARERAANKPQ